MWRRREGLSRKLAESGKELLGKIRTIREFAMEVTESDRRKDVDNYTDEVKMNVKATEGKRQIVSLARSDDFLKIAIPRSHIVVHFKSKTQRKTRRGI